MSTRDKSDFGAGKILPDELPGATVSDDASGPAGTDGVVHPERDGATGPDIAAAEAAERATHASTVESGAHFRADEGGDAPQEPVEPRHPPKHVRSADSA